MRSLLQNLIEIIRDAIRNNTTARDLVDRLNRFERRQVQPLLESRDVETARAANEITHILEAIRQSLQPRSNDQQNRPRTAEEQNERAQQRVTNSPNVNAPETFNVRRNLPRAGDGSAARNGSFGEAEAQPRSAAEVLSNVLLTLTIDLIRPTEAGRATAAAQEVNQKLIDILDLLNAQLKDTMLEFAVKRQHRPNTNVKGKAALEETTQHKLTQRTTSVDGILKEISTNSKGDIVSVEIVGKNVNNTEIISALRQLAELRPAELLSQINAMLPFIEKRSEIARVLQQLIPDLKLRPTNLSHLETAGGKVIKAIPGQNGGMRTLGGNIEGRPQPITPNRPPTPIRVTQPPLQLVQQPVAAQAKTMPVQTPQAQAVAKQVAITPQRAMNRLALSPQFQRLVINAIAQKGYPQIAQINPQVIAQTVQQVLSSAIQKAADLRNAPPSEARSLLTPENVAAAIVNHHAALLETSQLQTPSSANNPTAQSFIRVIGQAQRAADLTGLILFGEPAQETGKEVQVRGNIPISRAKAAPAREKSRPRITPAKMSETIQAFRDLVQTTKATGLDLPEPLETSLYAAGLEVVAAVSGQAPAELALPADSGKTGRLQTLLEIMQNQVISNNVGNIEQSAKLAPAAKTSLKSALGLSESDNPGFEIPAIEFLVGIIAARVNAATASTQEIVQTLQQTQTLKNIYQEVKNALENKNYAEVNRFICDLVLQANIISNGGTYNQEVIDQALRHVATELQRERQRVTRLTQRGGKRRVRVRRKRRVSSTTPKRPAQLKSA